MIRQLHFQTLAALVQSMRQGQLAGLLLLASLLAAQPAQSACRLALVLALDVSGSVDNLEYRQQTHGVAGHSYAHGLYVGP